MALRKVKQAKRKPLKVKRKVIKRPITKPEPSTKVIQSLYRKKQCVRKTLDGRIVRDNQVGDFSNFMGF
jgi:hypothetical protein